MQCLEKYEYVLEHLYLFVMDWDNNIKPVNLFYGSENLSLSFEKGEGMGGGGNGQLIWCEYQPLTCDLSLERSTYQKNKDV